MGPDREWLAAQIGESSQSLNEFPFLLSDWEKLKRLTPWPGLDGVAAEVGDAFLEANEFCLVRVETLEAMLFKPGINGLGPGAQAIRAALDEQQVVHVAQVGRGLELPLDEVIKGREIDVRTELAGEIANGEPTVRRLAEPALRVGDQLAVEG